MNITLDGMIEKGVFVYIDDIVIYAKTLQEDEELFEEVMNRLRKARWKLEPKKCELLRREVTYLARIISEKGLNPDPKKIKAVKEFSRLKNVKGVRQFLGLAAYYRHFIKHFAKIAETLTNLLQKNEVFHSTEDAQAAFENLKEAVCTAPLLQPPDMTKPFLITTDASGYAVNGILSQGKVDFCNKNFFELILGVNLSCNGSLLPSKYGSNPSGSTQTMFILLPPLQE